MVIGNYEKGIRRRKKRNDLPTKLIPLYSVLRKETGINEKL